MWVSEKERYYPRQTFIFFTKAFFLKLKFFRKLRRRFRKQCRRRRLSFLFFCKPNFLVHEKFKNARMGKGKGSPTHWVHKPKLDKPCAVLTGVNRTRAREVTRYLQKHVTPHLLCRRNFFCDHRNKQLLGSHGQERAKKPVPPVGASSAVARLGVVPRGVHQHGPFHPPGGRSA